MFIFMSLCVHLVAQSQYYKLLYAALSVYFNRKHGTYKIPLHFGKMAH